MLGVSAIHIRSHPPTASGQVIVSDRELNATRRFPIALKMPGRYCRRICASEILRNTTIRPEGRRCAARGPIRPPPRDRGGVGGWGVVETVSANLRVRRRADLIRPLIRGRTTARLLNLDPTRLDAPLAASSTRRPEPYRAGNINPPTIYLAYELFVAINIQPA